MISTSRKIDAILLNSKINRLRQACVGMQSTKVGMKWQQIGKISQKYTQAK